MSSTTIENHLFDDLLPEKFTWLELVGQGTFGKVYKCIYNGQQDKFFAIKRFVLTPNNSHQTKNKINQINVEMNNLNKLRLLPLKPSSIPQYYGYYTDIDKFSEANYCLVFEYLPKTLSSFIVDQAKSKEFVPFVKLNTFFHDLLHGLAYLQTIELSHRDLKPDNMAFDDAGHLKIIDFGIARDISELIKQVNSTNVPTKFQMTIGGTEAYMSPEVLNAYILQKAEPINAYKTDVFAFGLIVLEIGTLKKIVHNCAQNKDLKLLVEGIQSQLKSFKQTYHGLKGAEKNSFKLIFDLVKECVEIEANNRPDSLTLLKKFIDFHECKEKSLLHIFVDGMEKEQVKCLNEEIEYMRNNKKKIDVGSAFKERTKQIEDLTQEVEKRKNKYEDLQGKIKEKKVIWEEKIKTSEEKIAEYEKEINNFKQKNGNQEEVLLKKIQILEKEIVLSKKKNDLVQNKEGNEELLKKQSKESEILINNLKKEDSLIRDHLKDLEKNLSYYETKEAEKQKMLSLSEVCIKLHYY